MVTGAMLLCIIQGLGFGPTDAWGRPAPASDQVPQALVCARSEVLDAVFSDTIKVRRVNNMPPTLDGLIFAVEWAPSIHYDISDTAGRAGQRQLPGTNLAYYLYDDSFVYYACDCADYDRRQNYDQFVVYMDENNDMLWATDSSECCHRVWYVDRDEVIYPLLPWGPGPCPGAISVSSRVSGHLQFEAKIPIGSRRSDYTIAPGDTVRALQYVAVFGGTEYIGWWPQSLLMSQWADPRYYGIMVFDTTHAGLAARPGPDLPAASLFPNPCRARTTISYVLPRTGDVSLVVYDANGRAVNTLASGRIEAGCYTATWDAHGIAAGVYIFRLETGGSVVDRKLVVR